MKRYPIFPYSLILLLFTAFPAHAAKLTAKQILEKAAKPYSAINDYVVDVHVTAKSVSMHIPDMNLKIHFKSPDKVDIESKDSFAVLPRQGTLFGNPLREMLHGDNFILDKPGLVMGVDCYAVKVSFMRKGWKVDSTVWIDKKDFLVREISYVPELSPSMRIRLSYTKVSDRYWLPETTWAEVSAPLFLHSPPRVMQTGKPARPMTVVIRFSNYKVNTGQE